MIKINLVILELCWSIYANVFKLSVKQDDNGFLNVPSSLS